MSNQAAWIDGKGAKLRVDTAQIPKPGADEIVVKNHAVAVNPVDWKIQDIGFFIQQWPNVLGTDIAGEVIDVGANVKKFKKGDRVLAHTISLATNQPEDGGFQLYSRAPAVLAAILPDSISYKDGTVLPLAIDTASHGLYDSAEKGFFGLPYPSLNPASSGKTLVVWGGSSSVGALAIQLATASGAKVVAVASARNHEFVKSIGASATVDYNNASVVDDVVKAVQSMGGSFLGVYDAISVAETSTKHAVSIIEKLNGGNLSVVLPPPEDLPANIKVGRIFAVNFEVNGPVWETYVTPALQQGNLKTVPEALVVGKGLESIQKGFDTSKAGVSAKKVVIEL